MKSREYSIDLIKQMAECDANYIRLLKLIPILQAYRNKSLVKKSFFQGADKNTRVKQPEQPVQTTAKEQPLLQGRVAEFCIGDDRYFKQRIIVEISVIESFKYTTTLEIVQRPEVGKWISNPTMQVRIYHDASTAEVTSYQNHKNFEPKYVQPNPKMYHRDEKTQINRFLGEWLTHCLKMGRSVEVPDLVFSP